MSARGLLVVRIFRTDDPLVAVMQVAFEASEGEPFVQCMAGQIADAMHDTSGLLYDWRVEPCGRWESIAVASMLRVAREIAAAHRDALPVPAFCAPFARVEG